MTIEGIELGDYGITIKTDQGMFNLVAADAKRVGLWILAHNPELDEIMHRTKKVGIRNEALHNEVQDTTPFAPGAE